MQRAFPWGICIFYGGVKCPKLSSKIDPENRVCPVILVKNELKELKLWTFDPPLEFANAPMNCPLHFFPNSKKMQMAILGYGTDDKNPENNKGWTPLDVAIGNGHAHVYQLIMGILKHLPIAKKRKMCV